MDNARQQYDKYYVNGSPESLSDIRDRIVDDLREHTGVLLRVTGTIKGKPFTRDVTFVPDIADTRNGFFSLGHIMPEDTEARVRSIPMDNGGEYMELVAHLDDEGRSDEHIN